MTPGAALTDWMAGHQLSDAKMAVRLGCTAKHVYEMRHGQTGFSPDMARSLELVTGISAATWLGMQAAWQIAQLTGGE
jgi:addiction module HigA family antidote